MTDKNKRLYLVTFDISDNKRRRKLTNYLKARGIRVQRSVFECKGDEKLGVEIHEYLAGFYEMGDNLRIYHLLSDNDISVFGESLEKELDDFYIF